MEETEDRGIWPKKYNVFGVHISATNYDQALDAVMNAARRNSSSSCVSHLAVHGLIEGSRHTSFRSILNNFEIVAPDGQPVGLALNMLYGIKLQDRCYGPEFMLRVCRQAEIEGIRIFLYGSYGYVLAGLTKSLIMRFPKLQIAGYEPSAFRPLTYDEDRSLTRRINDSKAGIVFLGLGCPLQEKFADAHRDKIRAVQICVGAAFDFHAGNKKMAPRWMQRNSLEWLFRLLQEPRRLWKRYLSSNSIFILNLFLQFCRVKSFDAKINS